MFDHTVGGPNSTSFASVAEADALIESGIYGAVWSDTVEGDKEKALNSAATQINSLCFRGVKEVSTQALLFPMVFYTGVVLDQTIYTGVIPQQIKTAQIWLANLLVKANLVDPVNPLNPTVPTEIEALGLSKLKADTVELQFRDTSKDISTGSGRDLLLVPREILAYIPSQWLCSYVIPGSEKKKAKVTFLGQSRCYIDRMYFS